VLLSGFFVPDIKPKNMNMIKNKSGIFITKKPLMRKIIIIGLLLMPFYTWAQENTKGTFHKLPFTISYGNQVVDLPYQNLFQAFNPAVFTGTEFGYNKSRKHRLCQTLGIGFITNESIGNTITLNTDFCYRYTGKIGVLSDFSLGLGVINQYQARQKYSINVTTGEYKKVKDFGKPAMLAEYNYSLGYDFSVKKNLPFSLFIKYTCFVQMPYFDFKAFPVMPQSVLQLGTIIKIRKNEK
jgi:hypothetical protein